MEADPRTALDGDVAKTLLARAREQTTALAALEVMASLPGSHGPDLIHEVRNTAMEGSRIQRVAEELLYSQDVYKKSSNALRVALDLRHATDCTQYAALLQRAQRHADRRAQAGLRKLLHPRYECGDDGKQDCHSCVRRGALIKALSAAGRRESPEY